MNSERRSAGLLLPLFSVPGAPYIGSLGAEAARMAAFLADAGCRWWQMLPIHPIDAWHSPYSSGSAFAGEPLYLDPEHFYQNGLLNRSDLTEFRTAADFAPETVNYEAAEKLRRPLWRKAFEQFTRSRRGGRYRDIMESWTEENHFWLDDYLLFRVAADRFGTNDWSRWPETYRDRSPDALAELRSEHREEMDFHRFLQMAFDLQWFDFHRRCENLRLLLLGDVPIYVAAAGADTWAHRELFHLTCDGRLARISGVPADSFNPDGQRWNSPLYDWDRMEATGFDWWIRRIGKTLERFDAVRLDHFIGFYNYYSFPFKRRDRTLPVTPFEPTDGLVPTTPIDRDGGFWTAGPCEKLFDALFARFSTDSFIAEDLGVTTAGVHRLRDYYDLPGMEVLQFSFDGRSMGAPDPLESWPVRSVACTGTHDTETLVGWLRRIQKEGSACGIDAAFVAETLRKHLTDQQRAEIDTPSDSDLTPEENMRRLRLAALLAVMNSKSSTALFPVQDIFGLGEEARMNVPGQCDGNWRWRLTLKGLTDAAAATLARWVAESGRCDRNLSVD